MPALSTSPERSTALPARLIPPIRKCIAVSRARPPGVRASILVACAWLLLTAAGARAAALRPEQPLDAMYHTAWNGKDGLSGMVLDLIRIDRFFPTYYGHVCAAEYTRHRVHCVAPAASTCSGNHCLRPISQSVQLSVHYKPDVLTHLYTARD